MRVKLLRSNAVAPSKAHDDDVGYDLVFAPEGPKPSPVLIWPQQTQRLLTGVALELSCLGLIVDRSSMALKGLHVIGGVIDPGYRGEISVVLVNLGGQARYIQPGDKIAQLLLIPTLSPTVEVVDELTATVRGAAGFGSSGR
jgi:dUTP pyrophosphatase